ncbi:MAG: serine/threonine protein kinase, partial [Myxococcales bacterium]|nr:serine/threonine protein kinase [Myxococcales bacterium]
MAPRKPEEVSALVTDATVIAGTHSGLLSAAGEATLAADGGAAQLPATALQRGDSIDRYLILARLGEGGMGLVYAAHDPELDRKVAIKLLRGDPTDSGARDRLLREAQAMARLSHPNVITVHDVGTARGHVFVAMEYVEGGTLGTWLEEQERGWRAVLDVFLAAGRGLAAAHEAGLVHRDFKPDNVLLERDGRVRVADFGLARYGLGAAPTHPPAPAEAPTDMTRTGVSLNTKLTITGATVGTPAYMAPEQLGGVDVDARADQ